MCLTRAVVVDIILFRRNFAAGIIGGKLSRRIMFGHQRMAEHVGMRPPIGVARRTAIGHHKRRRITHLRLGEELQYIIVEHVQRDIVFNGGVAIGNQVHVHTEQ